MRQDTGNFKQEDIEKYEEEYFNFVKEVRGIDLTYYGNWQRDFGKLIIELAGLDPNPETILDVGCATALNLRAIDELGIFSRLIGVDISHYLIDMIPTLHDFGSYSEFYATPSHNLSMISDLSIDLILCTHVLEHLKNEEDLIDTLKEFQRVLKSNGKVLIIIPCTEIEGQDFKERNDVSPLHPLRHTKKWWSKIFSKYFKSESFKANITFKNTELKPNRNNEITFYEEYKSWNVFRLVTK